MRAGLCGLPHCEPVKNRPGGLFGLFLLDPMPAVERQYLNIPDKIGENLGERDHVLRSVDHESRLVDDGIHIRQDMPFAVLRDLSALRDEG